MLFLLAALPLAAAPAADHWVGLPGSGHPYLSIQAAVDAAEPGDRVLVDSGVYAPFVVNEAIQVTGRDSFATRVRSSDGQVPIRIAGDGSTGVRRVTGFAVELAVGATLPPAFVQVHDTLGPVELCDLRVVRDAYDARPGGGALLDVQRASAVFGASLRLTSQPQAATAIPGQEPFAAVRAVDSVLWLNEVRLTGTGAGGLADLGPVSGAPAVEALRSEVTLALGAAVGGAASDGGLAAPALSLVDSAARVHGGKSNRLAGGAVLALGTQPASGVVLDPSSRLTWASDVVIEASDDPFGPPLPAIEAAPGASLDPRADRLPSMWIVDPTPTIGATQALLLEGDPGAVHLWWLTLSTAPPIQFPGVDGPLLIDLTVLIPHAPVVIESNGVGLDSAVSPLDPSVVGWTFAYQSVELDGLHVQLAPPWFATMSAF